MLFAPFRISYAIGIIVLILPFVLFIKDIDRLNFDIIRKVFFHKTLHYFQKVQTSMDIITCSLLKMLQL